MPSGKTHDAITLFLVAPTFAATYFVMQNLPISIVVTIGMLFSGLMFGPDLDIHSTQYTRWGIFRFLWFPYKMCFTHRSRWSHGLLFGTLFRVVYFMGIVTIIAFLITHFLTIYWGESSPNLLDVTKTWQLIRNILRTNIGDYALVAMLIGLWIGAASHTFTDMAGTFIKHGKVEDFL